MDEYKVLQVIYKRMEKPNAPIDLFRDAFSLLQNAHAKSGEINLYDTRDLRQRLRKQAVKYKKHKDYDAAKELLALNMEILCYEATESFDSFMLYIEHKRPPQEQFWLPRRKHLMPICRALEEMERGDLKELFISLPPRVGKTTLILFFLLWVMGRDSERSNLYVSYTNGVPKTLYKGLLEVMNDEATYDFKKVFPAAPLADTDANSLQFNLGRKKRYSSFTGRSIEAELNGSCDCNGYLIGDDLISGIDEAMNKVLLDGKWTRVENNMIPRAKEFCRKLWIGTRWSLLDPAGRRIDFLQNDPHMANYKWKIISLPALNENDESNFDYAYGVGFSTKYYKERRASFERNEDMASWFAQYQNDPIERDGAVFSPEGLKYYNGVLPEGTPDRVIMAIDPAWGGGDYVAGVVGVQYGEDIYIPGVVYTNEEKNISQPLVVQAIERFGVKAVKVEGTKMTASYGTDIDNLLLQDEYRVNMQINTNHFTGKGKRMRIFDKAPEIREHMIFLEDGRRTKEYQQFMNCLYSFTVVGKEAKHDDAPDACAMLIDFALFKLISKAEVFKSPF